MRICVAKVFHFALQLDHKFCPHHIRKVLALASDLLYQASACVASPEMCLF